ncbi:hypothetical protein BB561_002274 [Smittium simulii]|uniref:glutathione transferase n=1 Tax=Smittium simulii TaxID=133385 RepID=A0A2T9YQZ5_9FUNG|nr:hypothetical protein BB561_002274 [Smittium simulii]
MSSYKVVYFPITARAQIIREILNLAGAKWENSVPNWPADKDAQPFNRLPVLIEAKPDGTEFVLTESRPIERYLAAQHGFLSADNYERARQEQLADQIADSYEAFIVHNYRQKTDESKAELEKALRFLFSKHESILAANPSGFYHGESISYPDLVLYSLYSQILANNSTDIFNATEAPHMYKLANKIHNMSAINSINHGI